MILCDSAFYPVESIIRRAACASIRVRVTRIVVIVDEIRIPFGTGYIVPTGDKIASSSRFSRIYHGQASVFLSAVTRGKLPIFRSSFLTLTSPFVPPTGSRYLSPLSSLHFLLGRDLAFNRNPPFRLENIFIRVTEARDAATLSKAQKALCARKYVLHARCARRVLARARASMYVCTQRGRGKEWSVWLNGWICGGQPASLRNPESNISMFSNQ